MDISVAIVIVATIFIVIGSILDVIGLYMAVKYKQSLNYIKSKMFYRLMGFGERITQYSFYALYIGAFMTIVKLLMNKL